MQIKAANGQMVTVAPSQIQKLKSELGHMEHHHMTKEVELDGQFDPVEAYKAACSYHNKAAENLRCIAQWQCVPKTEDQAKEALLDILLHGSSCEFADAIGQMCQFQAARVLKHSLKHCVKVHQMQQL